MAACRADCALVFGLGKRRWRVARTWAGIRTVSLLAVVLASGVLWGPACVRCAAQQSSGKSWTDSITAPFKSGFDKLGRALSPKSHTSSSTVEDDAVSLKSKAKIGPELYVAIAHLYEQAGKMPEAEQQYQLALKDRPDDVAALLGYAHLKEYMSKPDEAIQLYQRAAQAHPEQASIYNNLGLCYARQNRLDEAVAAMERAVQQEPKNALYRNNIAAVLVDQGKSLEALRHLREAHTGAAAYYNMGYLLQTKGQSQAAMQNFAAALKADPSMVPAQRWLEYLQRQTAQAQAPVGRSAGSSRTGDATDARAADLYRPDASHVRSQAVALPPPPALQPETAPMPEVALPRRLPPTQLRQPVSSDAPLSGVAAERAPAPVAPLPPSTSAVRPLPPVY